jgi:hypothetical protein
MKRTVGVLAFLVLVGCASADNRQFSQTEVIHEQIMLKYEFKAVIAAAKDLCTHGEGSTPFGYSPLSLYKTRVKAYNEGQARLKNQGYGGPAEYPEKIPNYDKGEFTDWCVVERKVTGLSCAEDL